MIDEKTRDFIRATIRTYLPDSGYRVFIFGSRASDRHHPYSDIDIGIKGDQPVGRESLMKIQESFDNSSLPIRIDIVDFSRVSPDFSRIARSTIVTL